MLDLTIAEQLADFVLRTQWDDLPANAVREGRRSFFNWLGCCIGGSGHESIALAQAAMLPFGGKEQATIIGRRARSDIFTATLLNCTSSSVHGFDDTHAETILHPAGPIATTLLALAETTPLTGRDFLLALVLGIEIECRLAKAISVAPAACKVGWYLTGLTGGIGAAAATAKVLGLNRQQLVWAMGIAASQSAGMRAAHASMTSGMIPAHTAQSGLRATYLARGGFDCSAHYFESPNGFLALFAEKANPQALLRGLGESYEVVRNNYKPFPCGIVLHAAVDACLTLHRRTLIAADEIQTIDVHVHPTALVLGNRPNPTTDLEAIVSLHQWVAAALLGHSNVAVNGIAMIDNPVIAAIRHKVKPTADTSLAPNAAFVAVTTRSGQVLKERIEHCIGSATSPMTDGDLQEKFTSLCDGVVERQRAESLVVSCTNFEMLTDVGALACAAA